LIIYFVSASAASTATLSRHDTPSPEQNGFGRSASVFCLEFNDPQSLIVEAAFKFKIIIFYSYSIIIFYPSHTHRQKQTRYHSTETRHGLRFARTHFGFDFRFEPFLPHGPMVAHRFVVPRRCMVVGLRRCVDVDVVGVDDIPGLPVPR